MQAPRPAPRRLLRMFVAAGAAFAAFMLVGNLFILGASAVATHLVPGGSAVPGVAKFQAVDAHVWRSAAPSPRGYEALIERGVTAVVDLRHPDEQGTIPRDLLEEAGVDLVEIPVRDGQAPTDAQIAAFLRVVDDAQGPVLVHCGAGVGRTGAMVAAYRATTGEASGIERLRDNLAIGPPSLEQIVFAATTDGEWQHPPGFVVTASRVLDGPRRLWHRIT